MDHDNKVPSATPPSTEGEADAVGGGKDAAKGSGGTESPPKDGQSFTKESARESTRDSTRDPKAKKKGKGRKPNNVRRLRIERMMSKAELARRANLSVLTIDRVEKGFGCRMDTKRKILEALGLSLTERVRVFGEEE